MTPPHHNQQLFSDHYIDVILPQRQDWQLLTVEVQPLMQEITAIFMKYKPSGKEAQAEYRLVRPVLEALGHTFEVQPSLITPHGTKTPDYVFYRDETSLEENKGKKLTEAILQSRAFAIGDAKYWNCPLDIAIKADGKDRELFINKNPSYQIAFYILHSGLEWGILTNGRFWRLYHKNTAHQLDHYYEVDLPALLTSGDVEQFLYFYAFFRRAAFDQHPLSIAAILKESIDYSQGISDALKKQVYESLRHVAQGFLDYPSNQLTPDDPTTLKEIYDNSLILLYRLLFILYAEARNLLPIYDSDLYSEDYSLRSMTQAIARDLDAGRTLRSVGTRLYHYLKELFGYINVGDPPLKISTFNGGLFDPQRHDFLEKYAIGDARLQQAIDMLARTDTNGHTERHFIDYRDLSVRNLGTIYEGLLEYHLETIQAKDGWTIDLLNDKGERKATGSYYTPDFIVKYIVDQTVGPVLQRVVAQAASDKSNVEALLTIKVLDPSMGSGHFLVEATEYIARFLVELNVQPEGVTKEAELVYWKRRVVQSCIYGVDLNPLAVELAKLSLWLSTVAKDRPLSFLDHHLRTGNSLIGTRLADLAVAPNGNGKIKKQEVPRAQLSLFDDEAFRQSMTLAVNLMWLVEDSPAQTVAQVKEQEQLYIEMREKLMGKYGKIANLYTATRYGISIDPTLWKPLVDFATDRILTAPAQFSEWLQEGTIIADKRGFFHWELEFPEVFFDKHGQPKREQAGFDAVVGNPPWIRQEMFSEDKAALKRYRVYHGVADLYTYFIELGNTFMKDRGHFGFITPNKFVRANYGAPLRKFLIEQVKLERLVNFGDLPVFQEATTYPMIMLTSKQPADESHVKYTLLKQLHPDNIVDDIKNAESLVPPSTLTEEHWHLNGTNIQTIVEKMKTASIPLGQLINGKIFYGIKTGLNEAFVIDRRTRDKLIADDPRSAEIIKPFLVGEDIKRYRVKYKNRHLIFTKRGIDLNNYKAIAQHLLQFKAELEPKPANWDDKLQGEWQGRKQGTYQWYEIQDTIAYYGEFEKPKIIFPDIAKGCTFAFDIEGMYSTNTTYFIPIDVSQKYLVPLLNSTLVDFFYRTISALIRGDYLRFFIQYVIQIPIRRIDFTTSSEVRSKLAKEGITLYDIGNKEDLLAFVEVRLANQPEQIDVIYDLLVYLAEQMIDFNKQRQQAVEDFAFDLKAELSDSQLQKISRLWTPLGAPKEGDKEAERRRTEAQQLLGSLAEEQLDLRDDIGKLNEEQWQWLLRGRLSGGYRLSNLIKAYRTYQPSIAAIDNRIATTNKVIDEIVYRLYGLTPEEIALVEGK